MDTRHPARRARGRPPGSGTGPTKTRVHVTLDPHLVEWAQAQPGGLSETVGRLLTREREREGVRVASAETRMSPDP